jgi:thiamine pyrophosphokinase
LKTLVVAHGDVAPSDRDQLSGADVVIAADGGALALEGWGVKPNVLVGDFDSLGLDRATAYKEGGATVARYPFAKDQSDLEIAMRFALETGADEIVLLGILGGERLDHALVNAMLLADPAYRGRGVRAVFGGTHLRALHAGETLTLHGAVGDTVTLVPVRGDADGVRTEGLQFPLTGQTLHFGKSLGLSNVIASAHARVSIERGVILVIEIAKEAQA